MLSRPASFLRKNSGRLAAVPRASEARCQCGAHSVASPRVSSGIGVAPSARVGRGPTIGASVSERPPMPDLFDFAVTRKWPARHPDRIQLYSLPTPNGVKVSIMLEESGLPYEPHRVSFDAGDQHSPEFHALNPNEKIPAILDPQGPGGKPLPLFESGAILLYLADKSGRLIPRDAAGRYATIQWLMFQMGGIGPMFGQVGFFHKFAGKA